VKLSDEIKWNSQKAKEWYSREDIFLLITSFNNFKYYATMSYNQDGTTNPPRRFLTIIGKRRDSYDFTLKYVGMFKQPTSLYHDVDNWKITRPFFSLDKETYKKQRLDFLGEKGETKYREHIHSTDFLFDIDGKDVYDGWNTAFQVVCLLRQFNVKYYIICSGMKGFQICIPYSHALKKEYFIHNDVEYNNFEAFATNLSAFIEDKDKKICMSMYSDLRFVKQPFSLDGRNLCPIVPLSHAEFFDFNNYRNHTYNPYMDFDYWNNKKDLLQRGFMFEGTETMQKLDEYLDDWCIKKLGDKK
jgi:hypothetical protein